MDNAISKYSIFWKHLKGDSIDVQKLLQAIIETYNSIEKCEIFYLKNQNINKMNYESKKIYGYFLAEILNKKEQGSKLVKEYCTYTKKKLKQFHNIDLIDLSSIDLIFETNSSPMMLLHKPLLSNNILVKSSNLEFCNFLGISRHSLNQTRLVDIIPEHSIEFYHKIMFRGKDEFLLRRANIVFKIRKKFLKFCNVDLKVIYVERESFCIIKINHKLKYQPQGNFLVDSSLDILGMDFGSVNVFHLNLSELFNLKNLEEISKKMKNIDLFQSMVQFVQIKGKMNLKIKVDKMSDSEFFMINFMTSNRFELNSLPNETRHKERKPQFEFILKKNFIFEGRFVWSSVRKQSKENLQILKKIKSEEKIKKINIIDYGKGIFTRRLINGIFEDITSNNSIFEEDDDLRLERRVIIKEKQRRENENEKTENRKISKFLISTQKKIKKFKFSRSQLTLLIFIIFYSFLSTTQRISMYFHQLSYMNRVELLIDASTQAGIRNDAIVSIWVRLHYLMLSNQGFDFPAQFDPKFTKEKFMKENLNYIKNDFEIYQKLQNNLFEVYRNFHNKTAIEELESEKFIEIIMQGDSKFYNYWDSQNIFYASVMKILAMKAEDITWENEDVLFVFQNIMEAFLRRFPKVNAIRFREIDDVLATTEYFYLLSFMILTARNGAILIVYFVMLHMFEKEIGKWTQVFLEFDQEYIEKSLQKCQEVENLLNEKNKYENIQNLKESEKIDKKKTQFVLKLKKKHINSTGQFITVNKLIFFIVLLIEYISSNRTYNSSISFVKDGVDLAISFRSIGASGSVLHFYQGLVEMMLYNENSLLHKTPIKRYLSYFDPYTHQLFQEFYYVTKKNKKIFLTEFFRIRQ